VTAIEAQHSCTTLKQLEPQFVSLTEKEDGRHVATIRLGAWAFTNDQITAARDELYQALRTYTLPTQNGDRQLIPEVEPRFEWSNSLKTHMLVLRVKPANAFSRGLHYKLVTVVSPRHLRGASATLEQSTGQSSAFEIVASGENAFELFDAYKPHQGSTTNGIEIAKVSFSQPPEQRAAVTVRVSDGDSPNKLAVWRQLNEFVNFYLDV